jgi:hypothetical protein
VENPLSSEEHRPESLDIGILCERSRGRSKTNCNQLFDALKRDDTQSLGSETLEDVLPEAPYYTDGSLLNLSDNMPHRKASIEPHQVCEETSVNDNPRRKSLGYARYARFLTSEDTRKRSSNKTKFNKSCDRHHTPMCTATSPDDSTQDKGVVKGSFTQTDTLWNNRSSDCMGVAKDAITQRDTFSSYHSGDFSGPFLELRLPIVPLAIAGLNKVMRLMLYLAAILTSLFVQVFCMQFEY